MSKFRYFLIEGETLKACQEWKERWSTVYDQWNEYAKSIGSKGYFSCPVRRSLSGLFPLENGFVPDGWRISNTSRSSMLVPTKKTKVGQRVRAEMDALPKLPLYEEIEKLIGYDPRVQYKAGTSSGFHRVGDLAPLQLIWAGETFAIILTDTQPTIDGILASHPDAVFSTGKWTKPDDLKEISEAEWDLITAQYKVAKEKEQS